MNKTQPIILFGDREFAEIAYEYFTYDSPYEVVAFTLEKNFITRNTFCGLPVVPFEELESLYPPSKFGLYIAIVYDKLNRTREKFFLAAKNKGYTLVSYISSRAFVWRNVLIGENCFIFEDNTIQPFVQIKDNVILWSGNHIGHGSIIDCHSFISSHVVVSGCCYVGHHCFLGVNSTLGNHVNIGPNSWVSSGAIITRDVPQNSLVRGASASVDALNEELLFKKLSTVSIRREA
jgi:sugar O-acyltransferase (sialic acid O-acetyltransferase NeuD family)